MRAGCDEQRRWGLLTDDVLLLLCRVHHRVHHGTVVCYYVSGEASPVRRASRGACQGPRLVYGLFRPSDIARPALRHDIEILASIAQLGERQTEDLKVAGSSPA